MATPESWLDAQLSALPDDPEAALVEALYDAQLDAINACLARTPEGLPYGLLLKCVAAASAGMIARLVADAEEHADEEDADDC